MRATSAASFVDSVGWVEFFTRPNNRGRMAMLGLAKARPNLVWGLKSQEAILRLRHFSISLISFLVRPRRFFVPTAVWQERRAQTRSSLAEGHRRRRREAGLTASSTVRAWRGRDDWWRPLADDMIQDWAVCEACGNTASPCIRSGLEGAGTLIFHARVKARPKEDGTHLHERCR